MDAEETSCSHVWIPQNGLMVYVATYGRESRTKLPAIFTSSTEICIPAERLVRRSVQCTNKARILEGCVGRSMGTTVCASEPCKVESQERIHYSSCWS